MSMLIVCPVRSRLVDAHQPCCARLVLDWLPKSDIAPALRPCNL